MFAEKIPVTHNTYDLAYEESKMLAFAIIRQACVDYYNVLKGKNKRLIPANTNEVSLEKFFESDYFTVLSENKLDGPSLAKKIKERAENGKKYALL